MEPLAIMKINTITFTLFILLISQASVAADWHFGLSGYYTVSNIDGFQQTPKGGQIGSTSLKRPDYDELHIKSNSDIRLDLMLGYNDFLLELEYLPIHLDGETILSSNLITHDIGLSSGRYFSAHVDDELYSLRFSYVYAMCSKWQVQPKLNVHWLSHDYHFESPPFASKRAFAASGISLGLQSDYQLFSQWLLSANLDVALPITNLDVYQAKLAIGYQYFYSNMTLIPTLSLKWHEVRFKDNQTIPNYLKYSATPTIALGIQIKWDI